MEIHEAFGNVESRGGSSHDRSRLAELLEREILQAERAGFVFFREIPCGAVKRSLHYLSIIGPSERRSFIHDLADEATRQFGFPACEEGWRPRREALDRFRAWSIQATDWRFQGVASWRALRGALRILPKGKRPPLTEDELNHLESVEPASSETLREAITERLRTELQARADGNRSGPWTFRLDPEVGEGTVSIGYDRSRAILRSRLHLLEGWDRANSGHALYDQLLGLGLGSWNQIEAGGEARAAALLSESIRRTILLTREAKRVCGD